MKHEHFWVMCAAAGTTLAIVVGAAGAAVAQPATEPVTVIGQREEDGLSVKVSYRDLNLASLHGERTLNRRVGGAAQFVCEGHYEMIAQSTCRSYAWEGARPQIALAVQRARELALNGTTSIPLVAISIIGR